MNLLLACLLSYLIGSFPLSRNQKAFFHMDRSAFRTFRISDTFGILLLDLCKGALAIVIAWFIAGIIAAHIAIIFVVLGEIYPCFPPRYSRNGWSVAAGAFLVVSPILILISLCIYLFSLIITRYFFWSTCLALISFFICLLVFAAHIYLWLIVICVAGMLTIHRPKWLHKGWRISRRIR